MLKCPVYNKQEPVLLLSMDYIAKSWTLPLTYYCSDNQSI